MGKNTKNLGEIMEETKQQLAQLYSKKGKLITNIEIDQQQLKIINQQIFQIMNTPEEKKE